MGRSGVEFEEAEMTGLEVKRAKKASMFVSSGGNVAWVVVGGAKDAIWGCKWYFAGGKG